MNTLNQSSTHIIIFAKAPIPGFAKTRLIPLLGEQGAADLANKLLHFSLEEALQSNLGSVELCVTPAHQHAYWQSLILDHRVTLSDQAEGDLGNRMASATKRALEKHSQVLLIGTDCPLIDRAYLLEAAAALRTSDACITKVSDGGYALLGLRQFDASIFETIPWSTHQVFELTRKRLEALNWSIRYLQPLHDIDEPEDLKYLPEPFQRTT